RLTRYPEGLASALEKISSSKMEPTYANKVTAPMCIVNPFKPKTDAILELTSTHPPIMQRIKILRSIASGVSYKEYQAAYEKIVGEDRPIIPPSGIEDKSRFQIRQPSVEKEPLQPEPKHAARGLGDLIRAVNNYAFLACPCGLTLKIPPNFKKSSISCPRCGCEHQVPLAKLSALTAATSQISKNHPTQKPVNDSEAYVKKRTGWESFL
ncbi:MAG: hypothetical protein V1753_04635, partial [Pseudomonadota bacterium]